MAKIGKMPVIARYFKMASGLHIKMLNRQEAERMALVIFTAAIAIMFFAVMIYGICTDK